MSQQVVGFKPVATSLLRALDPLGVRNDANRACPFLARLKRNLPQVVSAPRSLVHQATRQARPFGANFVVQYGFDLEGGRHNDRFRGFI